MVDITAQCTFTDPHVQPHDPHKIADPYFGALSMADDSLVRQEVSKMVGMQMPSRTISAFMSDELGKE